MFPEHVLVENAQSGDPPYDRLSAQIGKAILAVELVAGAVWLSIRLTESAAEILSTPVAGFPLYIILGAGFGCLCASVLIWRFRRLRMVAVLQVFAGCGIGVSALLWSQHHLQALSILDFVAAAYVSADGLSRLRMRFGKKRKKE